MRASLFWLVRILLPKSFRLSIFCPKYLRERVVRRTQLIVASGPFRGMRYLDESFASVLEPKLLGIYERELHSAVEEAVGLKFTRVIDIGAAEGYYAVGFALRLPGATVWAFEAENDARSLLKILAAKNNVSSRVHKLGPCQTSSLTEVLTEKGRTLVICDAEGGEGELLNPVLVPRLRRSWVLVELHSKKSPGIEETLRQRFGKTHHIQTLIQERRTFADFPYRTFPVSIFPKAYIENAVSEFRQPWEDWMKWFWMKPKES